jgi:predicted metal-dependent hydrolase
MKRYNVWATCNIKDRIINIDRRLALFRKEALEQVLIHELLHLVIREHNQEFIKLEEKYSPNIHAISWCLAKKNPDYRYYNFQIEQHEKKFEYGYVEYCKINNIKKEIL